MRTLRLMFICKLFQSRLQAGQLKFYGVSTGLVHVKTIAVFITHVQYLVEIYVVGNASSNNSFILPKTLTAFDPNVWPAVWMEYSAGFIVALDFDLDVESDLLMP